MMKRQMAVAVWMLLMLAAAAPAGAFQAKQQQQPPMKAGARLEEMLKQVDFPYKKVDEYRFIAVVTIEQQSERFQLILEPLGDEKKEELVIMKMYFQVAPLPEGAQIPAALAKQILEWNSNLPTGKIVKEGNGLWFVQTSWFEKSDAELIALNAGVGFMAAQGLRKDVAPYLK